METTGPSWARWLIETGFGATNKGGRFEYCVTAMSLQVVVGKNSVTEGE